MENDRILNEDISLEIAQYVALEEHVNMAQTCKLWYGLSQQYSRFWSSAIKTIPLAHIPRSVPLSEQTPADIRKAALRAVNSRRAWYTSKVVRPQSVVRLDVDFSRALVVPGTKWMLVLPTKDEDIPPRELVSSVECYDLTSGRLAGSFELTLNTTSQAYAPSWATGVAVSPTEIVVGIERYCKWNQYSMYYVHRIRLTQSPETDEITFTPELISLQSDLDCSMGLSPDGRFLSLDTGRGGYFYIYKTDGSTTPWEFAVDSHNDRTISFHGDMLVVLADATLEVTAVHLPSLLENWPKEIDDDDDEEHVIKLPSRSLGQTEGKHKLYSRKTDLASSYKAAIFDSLDRPDDDSGNALRFDIAYMKGDRCLAFPIKAEIAREDLVGRDDSIQVLKEIEPTAAEKEVATLPNDAHLTRLEGCPSQRTLIWSEEDPTTKVRKHFMHVIGVDKPGAARSLASHPDHQGMDRATIKWIDEASGLILMQDSESLLAVWI